MRTRSLFLLFALAGCTVGPNYSGPPTIAPNAAAGHAFVRAGDIPVDSRAPASRWWASLGDPLLDQLVDRAVANNPDLEAVRARLQQARASLRSEQANLLPKADATALYAHARIPGVDLNQSNGSSGDGTDSSGNSSGSGGASALNLYNVGFDASWEVDLFGGQRRKVEAARASTEAAQANIDDAIVSLTSEVVQAYVNLRDRQRRIGLNAESVAKQEQMLSLTRQRFDRGTASRLDVSRLQTQLDNSRADNVPLKAEMEAYLNALATLVGEEPGALDDQLRTPAAVPLPPAQVAIGDPALLLRHRPDIRAAERTLAADTAKIGTAEAARFPRLSIMGIIGVGGTRPSDLTKLDDFTLLAAPQLSWSFLDFGRTKAQVDQAKGVRAEAEAQYRSKVLGALRDAEDALARFRYRRVTVATLARAKASADQAAALSADRYKAGTTTLIDLLDTQRQQIAAEQSLSVAEAGLTTDFVSIQKALGLGWN
ncbi:efflux transporter outer membrane subunit [Flavisphingomonas formosensis]|uniref:efflux transporter outer membrane subunit n=1 Tax=Flavisphingomonas formosensis TaxID=861534 RepID=UPI0012FA973E|nr:efflux transporter outer membrane subunit [Sphingomonas formosensis]